MQDRSIVGRCPIELLTDVGLCVVDRGAELKEAAEGARLPRRHAGLRSWFGFRRQVLEFWRARQDLNPRPLIGWTLPSRYGVNCAKVEVWSDHLTERERPS